MNLIQKIQNCTEADFCLETFLEKLPFPAWIIEDSRKVYQNHACILVFGNMLGATLADYDFDDASLNRFQIEDIYVKQHGSLIVPNDVFYLRGVRHEFYKKLYFIDGRILAFGIPLDKQLIIQATFQGDQLTTIEFEAVDAVDTTYSIGIEKESQ